ncbi:MAG: hypothetical protein AAFO01_12545 [Pseudomonadota bacterium]
MPAPTPIGVPKREGSDGCGSHSKRYGMDGETLILIAGMFEKLDGRIVATA